MDIKERLKMLPDSPGVYMYSDKYGNIIYVGKAKVLKNRVKQYFQKSGLPIKTVKLVENIAEINWIVTDSEVEALMLECNLIKQHRPYFNILLKDDKSFPYIKLTLSEEYPCLELTRKRTANKDKYYGPYTNSYYARKTIEAINRCYPIKMCTKTVAYERKTGRVCLNYHINQCAGICQGNIDKETYSAWISQIDDILSGNFRILTDKLTEQMTAMAEALNFETANTVKELITCVSGLFEKQKISTSSFDERDVLGIASSDDISCIEIFCVREGRIAKTVTRYMKKTASDSEEDVMLSFLQQYYSSGVYIPGEILLNIELSENEVYSQFLSELMGGKCSIKTPKIGDKKKLADLAGKNAFMNIQLRETRTQAAKTKEDNALRELSALLNMQKLPKRIECYDISDISGADSVGVGVVFNGGKKSPKDYRRYRIKYVSGVDDYASMAEVVFRRLNRAKEELEQYAAAPKFLPLPEIIFVDGGMGHINTVSSIEKDFNYNITVAGLVKDSKHKLRGLMRADGTEIPVSSLVYSGKLLNEISEEVHRYAIEYHRSSRSKTMLKTELETIEGIGPKRCAALLSRFGSIEKIAEATDDELCSVEGMSRAAAIKIRQHFLPETTFKPKS